MGLATLEVGRKEAGLGRAMQEALGMRPVALQDESGMQFSDERVLELEVGARKNSFIGCEEAALTKMFEYMSQGGSFAMLVITESQIAIRWRTKVARTSS